MLCRIQISQTPEACIVSVAGRLSGAHVHDLFDVCAKAKGRVRVDLTDLLSVDGAGVEALRQLARQGAELTGVAQYLRYELEPTP